METRRRASAKDMSTTVLAVVIGNGITALAHALGVELSATETIAVATAIAGGMAPIIAAGRVALERMSSQLVDELESWGAEGDQSWADRVGEDGRVR